jgi:hypothetical protein
VTRQSGSHVISARFTTQYIYWNWHDLCYSDSRQIKIAYSKY